MDRFTHLLAAVAALVLVGCGGDPEAETAGVGERERASVLLVTLDTTNPGALDVYGKDRGLTPTIAALAAESELFDAARSVAPLTLPAHASMLTGLVPPRHGLRDNGIASLSYEAETLAEVATGAGYATAAFVSAAVLDATFGLDQGFDVYSAPSRAARGEGSYMIERSAPDTVELAREWLGARAEAGDGRPFFLWVHLFDPHVPYGAPAEALTRAKGNLYLAEVSAMDESLGLLFEALPRAEGPGAGARCAVVVVADHGESLGRHGEPTHSLLVHDATLHVPFLVRWPDRRRAGARSAAPVSVVDVFPTALGLFGVADEYDHDGVDLAAPPGPERAVYFESYAGYLSFGLAPLAGIADGRGKWIGGPGERLFLSESAPADPPAATGEAGSGSGAERYRAALSAILSRPALAPLTSRIGEVGGEALRELGYSGTATLTTALPSPLEATTRSSVRAGLEDALGCYEAVTAAGVGRRREAILRLEGILARRPESSFAAEMLGRYLFDEGRDEDAERVLSRLVDRGVAGADALAGLARVRLRLGRPAEAVVLFERAVALRPRDPKLARELAEARR